MRGKNRLRLGEPEISPDSVAAVYNRAGDDYMAYADGDPKRLFSFDGPHAYADRRVWSLLETKLEALKSAGADRVRILDAGCGPGTWLRRLVTRAHQLGFTEIIARGFDVADLQIQCARRHARELARLPGATVTFDIADITGPLPEADESVDITLCLYSVLSHLNAAARPAVARELARVTRGSLVTTVRSAGSTPTIFVDSLDKAREFELDHDRDQYEIELRDGYRMMVTFHLFTAAELRDCFAPFFEIEDLSGLDIFHSRFMPDPRWNPASYQVDPQLSVRLAELEEDHIRVPSFMERANHLLLVGRRRPRH